jgi:hypothetical protein
MGLDDETFWSLTPRQFSVLFETYTQHEKRWDIRINSLWWRYANAHRGKDQRMIPFDEMFPGLMGPMEPRENEQSFEDTVYLLEMWAATQRPGSVRVTRNPIAPNKSVA